MLAATLKLTLSERASRMVVPDLQALIPPSDISIFINHLGADHSATVECSRSTEVCSLLAATLMTWLRLCAAKGLQLWSNGDALDAKALDTQRLYGLLMAADAHLVMDFNQ
ncbi:hypothetical protein FEM41_18375 [Jejubacter calystegiae]|uniref:Uncharacterized protein n=1 Tax=Jejubacter calystegiae TaxID=2579935 RepID=A0A4P8YN09_9ENTR|nr:hypothetical protein [Jejubacter calystegiae]QCT21476.1 hypothetical protein FEM41_18375 [Jejubacter calystegiae]